LSRRRENPHGSTRSRSHSLHAPLGASGVFEGLRRHSNRWSSVEPRKVHVMSVQSFRSASLLAALFIGAATFPPPLSAQQATTGDRDRLAAQMSLYPTSAPVDTGRAASSAGPRIAPAGFTRHVAASLPGPAGPVDRSNTGDNE